MADKKITDLPVLLLGNIVPATDVIPVVNGGITKQVTLADAVIATFDALDPGVTSVNGRTGVVTLTSTDVGLANVNNTSDANKPVSTAQQTALNLKANIASPTFTGTVGGITSTMVGLGNVNNTSDVNKPVSTATQQALQSQLYTAFTTAGTSTAYTLIPSPVISAYTAGQSFFVNFNAACGAAPTLTINGVATPPNLVKENPDGTFSNLAAADVPINHRSRVTLLNATQAWVETLPDVSLGRGQTWQNVTASRSLSTVFTNSTGRPIAVSVSITDTVGGGSFGLAITVGGVALGSTLNLAGPGSGYIVSSFFVVPAGATYSATKLGGDAASLTTWAELR